jgi:hypothetical protein
VITLHQTPVFRPDLLTLAVLPRDRLPAFLAGDPQRLVMLPRDVIQLPLELAVAADPLPGQRPALYGVPHRATGLVLVPAVPEDRDYLIEKVSVKLPPAPRTYWPEISVAVTVIFMKP